MDFLINVLHVSSPYIGVTFTLLFLYFMFRNKLKIAVWFFKSNQMAIVALWAIALFSSPLLRPTSTQDINQDLVHQLEAEAEQVIKVEDLVLESKEEKTELRSKYSKYEPEL